MYSYFMIILIRDLDFYDDDLEIKIFKFFKYVLECFHYSYDISDYFNIVAIHKINFPITLLPEEYMRIYIEHIKIYTNVMSVKLKYNISSTILSKNLKRRLSLCNINNDPYSKMYAVIKLSEKEYFRLHKPAITRFEYTINKKLIYNIISERV